MQHGTQRKTVQHICITLLCSCFLIPIAASFAADALLTTTLVGGRYKQCQKRLVRLEPNDFPRRMLPMR